MQTPSTKPPQKQTCTRCGKFPAHSRQKRPAITVTCHKCGKKDTTKLCVRQERLHTLKWILITMIHTWKWILIFSLEHLQPILQVTLLTLLFKIDTRADVSVIPEVVFKQLQGVTLNPADHRLIGPRQNQLEVSGQFTAKLVHQNSVADEQIYIVKQLQESFWGDLGY